MGKRTDTAEETNGALALVGRYLSGLHRLAIFGLAAIQAIFDRIEIADRAGLHVGRAGLIFEKAHRAIRLLFALERRLLNGKHPSQIAAPTPMPEAPQPVSDQERRRASDRESGDSPERPRERDHFSRILKRPVEEIVALICRDLAPFPEWRSLVEAIWTGEDIDLEQLAAAPPPTAWPTERRDRPHNSPAPQPRIAAAPA